MNATDERMVTKGSELVPDAHVDQFWIRESRRFINRAIKLLGNGNAVSVGELRAFFSRSMLEICGALGLEFASYDGKSGESLLYIIREYLEGSNSDYD